jgi:hypothetical protein
VLHQRQRFGFHVDQHLITEVPEEEGEQHERCANERRVREAISEAGWVGEWMVVVVVVVVVVCVCVCVCVCMCVCVRVRVCVCVCGRGYGGLPCVGAIERCPSGWQMLGCHRAGRCARTVHP